MSWATDYSAIKTAIEGISHSPSYRLVPNTQSVEDALVDHGNACFTIRPVGSSLPKDMTSSGYLETDIVEVQIAYKCVNDTARNTAYDDFLTVKSTISGLSGYAGFPVVNTFDRIKDHEFYYKGTIKFYYGIRSS